MSSSFSTRMLKSYFWNFFSYGINFLKQLLLVPVFLKYMGKEQYSYWLIIIAIISIIVTLNFGYFQYVSNKINLTYRNEKNKAIEEFHSSFKMSVIQTIFLAVIIIFLSNDYAFSYISNIDINDVSNYNINYVFVLLAFSNLIYILFLGLIAKLYEPVKKENYFYRFIFVFNVVDIFLTISSIIIFHSLLIIALILSLSRIIVLFIFSMNIKKNAPDFYPWWQGGNIHFELKTIKKSLFLIYSNIVEKFQYEGFIIFISHYLGENIVAVFSSIRTISNSAIGSVANIINPTLPEAQSDFAQKKWNKILDILFTNILISSFLISFFFLIITPYIEWIFGIWTNHKLQFDQNFYFFIVVMSIIYSFTYNVFSLIRAFNYTKNTFIIVVLKVIILFTVPFIFSKNLESIGKAMAISELGGLIVGIVFLTMIFPQKYFLRQAKLFISTTIPCIIGIIGIYFMLNKSTNQIIFIIFYLVLIIGTLFFNRNKKILHFIKK